MKQEIKNCQSCKSKFTIEPDDFDFYQKIQVPAPTFCPKCRLIRRMVWRNERSLYKRKCDLTGKEIISQYPLKTQFPVYEMTTFYSRDWEVPFLDYNPEKSFFEQFKELFQKTPRGALVTDLISIENGSIYQNASSRNKNCYLVFATGDSENCMYGLSIDYGKDSLDSLFLRKSELCYECINCFGCYRILFSQDCNNCSNSYFLFDCNNCSDCFGCVELRNKQYCYFNKQYSKEEYREKLSDFVRNMTQLDINKIRSKFLEFILTKPHKYAHNYHSQGCSGDFIYDSKNVKNSFIMYDSKDCKYCFKVIKGKDCYDFSDWADPAELVYESITVGKDAYNVLFSNNCWPGCSDIQYCDSCSTSHSLFGCISLKNASYRILNKQYSKQEYKNLVPKIIEKMKQDKEYGEFFPIELSPFTYNETMAQEWFPITRKESEKRGYKWRNQEERDYKLTFSWKDLPKNISNTKNSIIKEIIVCQAWDKNSEKAQRHNCTKAFRVLPDELTFYRQMKLPLPIKCPNTRHFERFQQLNPLELWDRKCQCAGEKSDNKVYQNTIEHFHKHNHCPNEFKTTYAPERKEIVYCEACYQQEVV